MLDYLKSPSWEMVERLHSIVYKTDHLTHLRLVWETGEEWDPVNRWLIYQMFPPSRTPPLLKHILSGPNPRNFWYWDKQRHQIIRASNAPMCTFVQWDLYRKTGCWAKPYWVIQGAHGGNKLQFTTAERYIAMLHGVPTTPPPVGSLPYAPFDERVVSKLAELDLARRRNYVFGAYLADPQKFDRDESYQIEQIKDQLWEHIKTQIRQDYEEAPWAAKAAMSESVTGNRPVRIFT